MLLSGDKEINHEFLYFLTATRKLTIDFYVYEQREPN